MAKHQNPGRIRLPRGWPQHVRSALLHVISLAQYAVTYTRGWAIDSPIGRLRLIALIERFIRTMKDEGTRRILVPQRRSTFRYVIGDFFAWYNEWRPHTALEGRTPNEVYFRLRPVNRRPRIEPRARWPRRSPCARPRTLIAGQPGDRFTLDIKFLGGQRHLPVVSLKRAA
jgi:hypothetical protein